MSNSTKYNRTMHFPFSPGTTSDDRISREYDFLENREIVITEKMDGENNGMNNLGVFARSHAIFTESKWSLPVRMIHNNIKHLIDDDIFVFGEGMGAIHSLEYKALESHYYIFGVRYKDEWLCWDDVCEWAYILNLPTVPLLFRGVTVDLKSLVLETVKKPSVLEAYDTQSGEAMMEGCVVRNSGMFKDSEFSRNLLKWVRPGHVNTGEHWTKNWKRQPLKWENEKG